MGTSHEFPDMSEGDVARLAQEIAFFAQLGDVIALKGDLGAGKTTFSRALLRAVSGDSSLEVPSPTFTLVQNYETPRFEVAHFDLYRLVDPAELDELGLEAAQQRGVVLIEWPERGAGRLGEERLTLLFEDTGVADRRSLKISAASPTLQVRLDRLLAIRSFLNDAGWGEADTRVSYLQGDASPRRYARLTKPDGTRAILMDSPRRPDGPALRDGKPYSAIAHLAEDVRPFVAISQALRTAGFSAPEVLNSDLEQGLLIIEDFGDRVYGAEVARGADQEDLWRRATDALVELRCYAPPEVIPLTDGTEYCLPRADIGVLEIETELLVDWYWPAALGAQADAEARNSFREEWRAVFTRVLAGPQGWLLRDFHSPNLIALAGDDSPRDVGIIDFQDAMIGPLAYDLVSLLQDARVDVPAELEAVLLDRYVDRMRTFEPNFDPAEFRFAYAALGAQRNTKILGIFARLAMRDGKRQYLAHIARIWGYLERDLKHQGLSALAAWYDRHLPPSKRTDALNI